MKNVTRQHWCVEVPVRKKDGTFGRMIKTMDDEAVDALMATTGEGRCAVDDWMDEKEPSEEQVGWLTKYGHPDAAELVHPGAHPDRAAKVLVQEILYVKRDRTDTARQAPKPSGAARKLRLSEIDDQLGEVGQLLPR